MYDNAGLCSTGTAFFYAKDDKWYLVTNKHNFTGKHAFTDEAITHGRLPTHIEILISTFIGPPPYNAQTRFSTSPLRVDIYQDYQPAWYEHPSHKVCDVVAPPLERPHSCANFMHNAANLIDSTQIPLKPGGTAFVIGFPRSLSIGFGLPLWKSGYIASEPFYDVKVGRDFSPSGFTGGTQVPAFFIDTQTREGMSGSPFFSSYSGTWDTSDPYRQIDPAESGFFESNDIVLAATAMEFIGCYSGRVGPKEEGAALGLCWRKEVIDEICVNRMKAQHPHVSASAS